MLNDKLTVRESRVPEIDDEYFLQKQIENWTGRHIAKWIAGLGDSMNPILVNIRDNIKSGRHLFLIDSDRLIEIGITGLGARKMILQAIQLLEYFCYEAPNENLQTLAHKTALACSAAARVLLDAQKLRQNKERPIQKAELVGILNSLTIAISNLAEHSKRLLFWLDRSPFDENSHYINLRDQISESIWGIVQSINVSSTVSSSRPAGEIVKKMESLKAVCDNIVYKSDDPSVLYTTNYECAVLQRSSGSGDWGINVQSSYLGVHVISEIKEHSPADRCGKIDAGDEILMINGKMVIGWDLKRVAQRLGQKNEEKLRLIVNKRPRDTVPLLIKNAPKALSRPLATMAPGSQTGYSSAVGRGFVNDNMMYPLNRRRSSTFIGKLRDSPQTQSLEHTRISRRASISCGRERQELFPDVERPQYLQWNLADILGPSFETRFVRRARTMRQMPNEYVRSFIDNKLVQEVEEEIVVEQLPCNIKCPTEFAKITVIDEIEMVQHGLSDPKLSDGEWNAPPNDITTQRFIVPVRDLNVSSPGLDSPKRLSNFDHDMGVLPSPSSSSMNSVSSPAPLKLMSLSTLDWPSSGSHSEVPLTPLTPMTMLSNEKTFEGWARRRKTGQELSETTNKWPKCWMVLRGPYLSCYTNQYSQHPDFTINVTKCTVSDVVDIKTSKKFVFRLQRPSVDYYFSCFNNPDQKAWIQKIVMATEVFQSQSRVMSKSVSYFKEGEGDSHSQHYNTMTGLPSLMTSNTANSSDPVNSPGSHSSLPRTGFLSSLTSRTNPSQASIRPKK